MVRFEEEYDSIAEYAAGYDAGGRIEPQKAELSEDLVGIVFGEPQSVYPMSVVAKYGRDFLIKLQGGGEVFTADEVLAAYDEDDEQD